MAGWDEGQKQYKILDEIPDLYERLCVIDRAFLRSQIKAINRIDIRNYEAWLNRVRVPQPKQLEILFVGLKLAYSDIKLEFDKYVAMVAAVSGKEIDDLRPTSAPPSGHPDTMRTKPASEPRKAKASEILGVTRERGLDRDAVRDWYHNGFKGYWYLWIQWVDMTRGVKTPVTVKSLLWAYDYDKSTNTILVKLTTRLWYKRGEGVRWSYAGWVILTQRRCYMILEDVKGLEYEVMTFVSNMPGDAATFRSLHGLLVTTIDDTITSESIPTATRAVFRKIPGISEEADEAQLVDLLAEVDTYKRKDIDEATRKLIACDLDETNVLMHKLPEEGET